MSTPAVDVFGIDLAISEPRARELALCLDAGERDRAAGLRFEQDRLRFIAAHAGMRLVLSRHTGEPPEALRLRPGKFGKPFLPDHSRTHFNLTHSGSLALLAICEGGAVGIDVEQLREVDDMDAVAQEVFMQQEREALQVHAREDRCRAFFNGWTRKEALIKATGEGFSADLSRIGVTLCPNQAPAVTHWPHDLPPSRQWRLAAFEPRTGYVAAVACRGSTAPQITLHTPAPATVAGH